MNQYGLNMPGGQMHRGPSMNVYTGLLLLAAVALIGACAFVVFYAHPLVGPADGMPFDTHPYNEQTQKWDVKLKAN